MAVAYGPDAVDEIGGGRSAVGSLRRREAGDIGTDRCPAASGRAGQAGSPDIPEGIGNRTVIFADQPAYVSAAIDRADRIDVVDRAVALVPADQPADILVAGNRPGGIGVLDGAFVHAGQPADAVAAEQRNRAAGEGLRDRPVILANEPADTAAGRNDKGGVGKAVLDGGRPVVEPHQATGGGYRAAGRDDAAVTGGGDGRVGFVGADRAADLAAAGASADDDRGIAA